MYKLIAERKARQVFENLSRGDYEATLEDIADDVHHVFPAHIGSGSAAARARTSTPIWTPTS